MNKDILLSVLTRPIAYHPILAKILDNSVKASIFLSQMIYWTDRQFDKNGWIYKKYDEIGSETSLSRREIDLVRKICRKYGVIDEKKQGMPSKIYYKINLTKIYELVNTMHQTAKQYAPKRQYTIHRVLHRNENADAFSSLKEIKYKKHMEDIIECDEDGNEIKRKQKKAKGQGKNQIALRIVHKFGDLCFKEFRKKPIQDIKAYKMALFAINTGGLTENQVYDLFDEWFSLGKPDEETIQITRALSSNHINDYKARNL